MFTSSLDTVSPQSFDHRPSDPKPAFHRFRHSKTCTPRSASPSSTTTNIISETGRIPRPLNSFMIFRLEKQREIVDKCPGANHRDISKIISKWWKELSKYEKDYYISEAEKRKVEHRALYPDYKFCPQKRITKIRRYRKRAKNESVARDFENKQSLSALFKGEMPAYKSSSPNEDVSSDKKAIIHHENSGKEFEFINIQPITSLSNNGNDSVGGYSIPSIKLPKIPQLQVPELASGASMYCPTTSYYTVPPGAYSVPSQSTAYIYPSTAAAISRTKPWINYNIYADYYGSSVDGHSHNPYIIGGGTAATRLHYITPNHYLHPTPPPLQYNISCLYPYDSYHSTKISSDSSGSSCASSSSSTSSATSNTEPATIAPNLLTQSFLYNS